MFFKKMFSIIFALLMILGLIVPVVSLVNLVLFSVISSVFYYSSKNLTNKDMAYLWLKVTGFCFSSWIIASFLIFLPVYLSIDANNTDLLIVGISNSVALGIRIASIISIGLSFLVINILNSKSLVKIENTHSPDFTLIDKSIYGYKRYIATSYSLMFFFPVFFAIPLAIISFVKLNLCKITDEFILSHLKNIMTFSFKFSVLMTIFIVVIYASMVNYGLTLEQFFALYGDAPEVIYQTNLGVIFGGLSILMLFTIIWCLYKEIKGIWFFISNRSITFKTVNPK